MGVQLKTHQPCPDCGSSDALTYYDWGTKCFSAVCGKVTFNRDQIPEIKMVHNVNKNKQFSPVTGVIRSITDRNISKQTCEFFNVVVAHEHYHFPYADEFGKTVAYKKRHVDQKEFHIDGSWSQGKLFGQHLFSKGGKFITLTEGEFDTLAAWQMVGSRPTNPVVSVRNGAGNAVADCRANFEFLDSFANIVICFDADEAGQQSARQVAELFGAKAKIFKSIPGFKDACDFLREGNEKRFLEQWWEAERYVPDGIIDGSTLWEEVSKPVEKSLVNYPYKGLNDLTFGVRASELVTVTAGSGLGKSQFMREIVFHILNNTEDNIGLMFLEESVRKTGRSLMSLSANRPLHLPSVIASEQELRSAFDQTLGTGRMFLFDHFGSTAIDNIVNRVRYLAKGLNCRYVFLDHVSIVVSSQEHGDERRALDEIMTRLRMLVQETDICLFVVSHLKRPDGKGHEEGVATSLSQLRGSGSIAQLSDIVLGLERNGQAEDIEDRHTTRVRVLKNRFSGLTGPACSLLYNLDSGRMSERKDDEL